MGNGPGALLGLHVVTGNSTEHKESIMSETPADPSQSPGEGFPFDPTQDPPLEDPAVPPQDSPGPPTGPSGQPDDPALEDPQHPPAGDRPE
jgi:hypothetical protein